MDGNSFKVYLTNEEIESISQEIDELFSQAAGEDIGWEVQLLQIINNYLLQLNTLQAEIIQVRDSILQQSNSTLSKMSQALRQKGYQNMEKKIAYETMRQNQIFQKMQKVFSNGYILVNKIREYIVGQTIQYHVAIERGKTRDSIIYSATEEHIIKNLNIDTYRFMQSLFSSQAQELDYNARYTAAVKRSQIEGQTKQLNAQLPKQGSTLWSKGYRVFLVAKQNSELAAYVNFGHFLEAYYYFGGNKENRRIKNFNPIEFYQYMVALQNSIPFYQAGDFQNIQLKSNTATIANINTIKEVLIGIQTVLFNYKGSKKKKIKEMLTTKKYTKQQLAVKASEIDVPEELEQLLLSFEKI